MDEMRAIGGGCGGNHVYCRCFTMPKVGCWAVMHVRRLVPCQVLAIFGREKYIQKES